MKRILAFLLAAVLGTGSGLGISLAFQMTQVEDNGMLPTYEYGEKALVSKFAYAGDRKPARGDVILIPNRVYAVTGENGIMMKRIVAVGGDRVMITGGKVYVNNREIEEGYVFSQGTGGEMEQVRVPIGKVFVLGDNRTASTDSRSEFVGMPDESEILGKVIFTW